MISALQRDSNRGLVLAPVTRQGIQDPSGSLADFQLRTDKKARVFIPVATSLEGPAWGSEFGINLETGLVYDDLTDGISHPGRFMAAYSGGGMTTVTVANIEIDTFAGLARRSPVHVDLTVDAVFDNPQNWDLLRYSLRSLHMYAPWIRTIYLVTDEPLPSWLDVSQPGIEVVSAGETSPVHALLELAEHYLLVRDTSMLASWSEPGRFFAPSGLVRVHISGEPIHIGDPGLSQTDAGRASLALNRWSVERYGRTANLAIPSTVVATTKAIEQLATDELAHLSPGEDSIDPISLAQHVALYEAKAVEVRTGLKEDDLAVDGTQFDAKYLNKAYPIPSPWEVEDENPSH